MSSDSLGQCLTREELCGLLRITLETSRKMDREGTGPRPIRVSPRIVRYPLSEVTAFMNAAGLEAPPEVRGSSLVDCA